VSNTFGKNLKAYRTMLNMTQEDLAKAAGIKRSALSNYELGRSEPDFEIFVRFSRVLGVDPMDLLLEHDSYPDFYRMMQVTEDEEYLLELYRHTDEVYQQVAQDILMQHQTSGRFAKK